LTVIVPPSAVALSDRSLLRRFRGGDNEAATRLYMRYAHRLWTLASTQLARDVAARLNAGDVVEFVFRSFFKDAKAGLYDLPDGDELWKLLLVIALRKIRAGGAYHPVAKRDGCRTESGDALDALAGRLTGDPQAHAVLCLAVEETLSRLPEVSQTIVALRMDGFAVAEIAVKTGRSNRSVERNLQEFRKKVVQVVA
jgi:RNA polymerase sigma-70 factor (ECF subfamily)